VNSPLGQYAAPAAAVASLAIIAAYLISLLFQNVLQLGDATIGSLQSIAFLAAGALFGSSVAVNGYKAPLAAAHRRLDTLTSAIAANAAAISPTAVTTVTKIIADDSDATAA
jgi:hypothetical protein